jgi:hypothetical protein
MFFLVCSASVFAQNQSVIVKFVESKRHIAITMKTPEPINPGVQGEFLIQFRRGENYVVYNDTSLKNGRVRKVEFDTPKLDFIHLLFEKETAD